MTRRFDYATAEKISIALLTRAAFGAAAGLRTASLYGIPTPLATKVFDRDHQLTRSEIPALEAKLDRRNFVRMD